MSESEIPAPFDRHRETVPPAWIDYNGHMNVGYYGIAFDRAVDTFYDYIGLGEGYRQATGFSTFAVEQHVLYQAELKLGDPLRITTQVLGVDDKRLHIFQRMYHAETGRAAACLENISVNVDMRIRRVAPFPADIQARLGEVLAAHARLPRPPEAGRSIALGTRAAARHSRE